MFLNIVITKLFFIKMYQHIITFFLYLNVLFYKREIEIKTWVIYVYTPVYYVILTQAIIIITIIISVVVLTTKIVRVVFNFNLTNIYACYCKL